MSLEYAPLMADLYWTRVVQYYGDKHAREDANIQLLWPASGCDDDPRSKFDRSLSLRLDVFERAGSARRGPAGPGPSNYWSAEFRANPEFWRFYEDLGFIYYFNLKDYRKAAEGVSGRQQATGRAHLDEGV